MFTFNLFFNICSASHLSSIQTLIGVRVGNCCNQRTVVPHEYAPLAEITLSKKTIIKRMLHLSTLTLDRYRFTKERTQSFPI